MAKDTVSQTRTVSDMEQAFGADVPALTPIGQPVTVLEARQPVGAQKVAVYRDENRILQKIKVYAMAAGDDFYYRWEVNNRRENRKDVVEGPSVKAALTVARLFGNCEINMRVKDEGASWIFYARFYDSETGYVLERAFQQRKGQNTGMKDADRQLDIVFQIGQSKAIRNVICNALAPFTEFALQEAKQAIVDKIGKDIEGYRKKLAQRFEELKIDIKRPEAAIGKTIDKWFAPDMARLIAEIQTVNDGMSDPDDVWPNPQPDAPRPKQEDEQPARQIEQDRAEQRQPSQQAKESGDSAKASEKAKPETADEIADSVTKAIELAKTADGPTLEQLDDNTCSICDRAGREDQRKRWNEVYLSRRNELRVAKAQPQQKVQEQPKSEQSVQDFYDDSLKELAKAKTIPEVDDLQDRVGNELSGDDILSDQWKNACNARAREIMGGRRR